MDRGVIYCAIGDKYIEQVITSANGVKKHNPNLKVALFSDKVVKHPSIDINIDIFEKKKDIDAYDILKATDRLPSMKIMICNRSPFEKTLSLDSDTYVRGNIEDVFDYLDMHDMLFTKHDNCLWEPISGTWRSRVTKFISFSLNNWYNAGVIAYKNTKHVNRFLSLWRDVTIGKTGSNVDLKDKNDQEVLNILLSRKCLSGVKWSGNVLDNKIYNAVDRIWVEMQKKGFWNDAKILHTGLSGYLKELDSGERKYDDLTEHEYFNVFK